ncbi:MAG: acetyl-CoA C-acyltransferase, partial [Pseudomonadota bacterium]|nr:acetyl-CoA C-acyltransferase [Pseudomonadota bacterium]
MTKEAVIVATARTPIGRAYRGAFNDTDAPTLGGHVIAEAVRRAGIEPGEVDDVIMGCAMQQGTSGYNIGRTAAVAAGLPSSVSGMSIDRQCASGMMAICTAAKQVVNDNMPIVVGSGLDSISLVQNEHRNGFRAQSPSVTGKSEHAYMSMLETAEVVAKRYNISREQQDEYALQSQQRTAAAQQAGAFDAELAPLPSKMVFVDKETKEQSVHDVHLEKD